MDYHGPEIFRADMQEIYATVAPLMERAPGEVPTIVVGRIGGIDYSGDRVVVRGLDSDHGTIDALVSARINTGMTPQLREKLAQFNVTGVGSGVEFSLPQDAIVVDPYSAALYFFATRNVQEEFEDKDREGFATFIRTVSYPSNVAQALIRWDLGNTAPRRVLREEVLRSGKAYAASSGEGNGAGASLEYVVEDKDPAMDARVMAAADYLMELEILQYEVLVGRAIGDRLMPLMQPLPASDLFTPDTIVRAYQIAKAKPQLLLGYARLKIAEAAAERKPISVLLLEAEARASS